MRGFGFLVEGKARFSTPSIPGERLSRANPSVVRRLDEGIMDVFNLACLADELEAAADLLALMEKCHARRSYGDEDDRRTDAIYRRRMQGELARRHIARGSRPDASLSVTGPSATGPSATGPSATRPSATGPSATGL